MALTPPGGATTYDKVRDWALDAAGFQGDPPVTPEVIDILLLNGLQQLYSEVWNDDKYKTFWDFTVLAGDTNVKVASVTQTTDEVFDPMYRIIHKFQRLRDGREVWRADSPPESNASIEVDDDPHMIVWHAWGDTFRVAPPASQDEDYRVHGYRELNRTIWTEDPPASGTVVWEEVDLPVEFMEVYYKIVLGFLFAAVEDTVRATQWLTLASDELGTLLAMNNGEEVDRRPENGPFIMNSKRLNRLDYLVDGVVVFPV